MARRADGISAPGMAADAHQALLRSVAEQLKSPLMYVARQAEFCQDEETVRPSVFRDMQNNADMALRLVDSYILGLDLLTKQMPLQLEPVPISAVLYDVAHDLTPLLRQRNTELQLVLAGKYGEVMAHRDGLMAALYNVGSVLSEIEVPGQEKHTVKIVAHHSPRGIVAGMYMDEDAPTLSLAQGKAGNATPRQLFAQATAHSGAGVFVADTILASMNTRLRSGRFRGTHGLAATLQPNRQLQLV